MTKKFSKFILIFAAYALFLLWTFPAIQAYQLLRPQLPSVQMTSLKGTIWTAQVRNLKIGSTLFRSGQLSLNLVPLLAGSVSVDVHLKSLLGSSKGTINIDQNGFFSAYAFKTKISAASLAQLLGYKVNARGTVIIDLDRATFSDRHLKHASGMVRWVNAIIEGPVKLDFGTITILLKTRKNRITGLISNRGVKTKLTGTIVFKTDKTFKVNLKIKNNSKLGQTIVALIGPIASVDNGGNVKINFAGKL